jgi:hypothetical protein
MTPTNYQWFITAIESQKEGVSNAEYFTKHPPRTFGFYAEYSDAVVAILANTMNMHECIYDYIVLEKIGEGIHPQTEEEYWFKWNGSKWEMCEKPAFVCFICNFALG